MGWVRAVGLAALTACGGGDEAEETCGGSIEDYCGAACPELPSAAELEGSDREFVLRCGGYEIWVVGESDLWSNAYFYAEGELVRVFISSDVPVCDPDVYQKSYGRDVDCGESCRLYGATWGGDEDCPN